jgi:hypothetical protein
MSSTSSQIATKNIRTPEYEVELTPETSCVQNILHNYDVRNWSIKELKCSTQTISKSAAGAIAVHLRCFTPDDDTGTGEPRVDTGTVKTDE